MTTSLDADTGREAIRAIVRASRLLERTCDELSLPHYRVLAAVAAGEERASVLAARLALGKPTVSASVDSLVRRGYLERGDVEGDQRAAALRLTEDGAAALATTERAMLDRLATVLDRTDDAARVLAGLTELGAGLDRVAADRLAERGCPAR